MTGTQAVFNSLETFATPLAGVQKNAAYGLLIFATNWGYTGSWDTFASRIKKDGYDGAELWYPSDPAQRSQSQACRSITKPTGRAYFTPRQ